MKNLLRLLSVVFLLMTWGFVSCSDDKDDPKPDLDPIAEKSAVEFALPDFNDSYVYLVTDATTTLAEVCKEYIPTFSKEKQAVVVYPYDKDGKVDHTKGFVADNGGSIRWSADGSYEYKAGTSGAVTKLYVDSSKIIASAEPLKTALVQPDQLKDYDGNLYGIVKIGTQYWTTSNYKTKHFKDGSEIVTGLVEDEWTENTAGAYTVYDIEADFSYDPEMPNPKPITDDISSPEKITAGYGLLYNWHAASSTKFIPDGWNLPSGGDMEKLQEFLDNGVAEEESTAGGMLKEAGLIHWVEGTEWTESGDEVGIGNVGATNVSGFTAVGAGSVSWGMSMGIKNTLNLWTSSEADEDWFIELGYKLYFGVKNNSDKLERSDSDPTELKSVRFVRK